VDRPGWYASPCLQRLGHVDALSQAADFQSLDDLTKTHAAQNGEYKRLNAILRDLERQHANDEHAR
jgi:hypothetical protein